MKNPRPQKEALMPAQPVTLSESLKGLLLLESVSCRAGDSTELHCCGQETLQVPQRCHRLSPPRWHRQDETELMEQHVGRPARFSVTARMCSSCIFKEKPVPSTPLPSPPAPYQAHSQAR